MTQSEQFFSTVYRCAVFDMKVTIRGVQATVLGEIPLVPIAIANTYTRCSGSPACGHSFKGPGCPYNGSN